MSEAYWLPTLTLSPQWNITQKTFFPKMTTLLGDNYSQSQNKGLEPISEWDVKSPIMPQNQLDTLLLNLRNYTTTNFLWSPTGQNLKQCSLVSDWTITPSGVFNGQVYSAVSNRIVTSKIRNNFSVPRTDTYPITNLTASFMFAFYSAKANTTTCVFSVVRTNDTVQRLVPWKVTGSQSSGATAAIASDFENNIFPSGFLNFTQNQSILYDPIKISLIGDRTVFTDPTGLLNKKAFTVSYMPSPIFFI